MVLSDLNYLYESSVIELGETLSAIDKINHQPSFNLKNKFYLNCSKNLTSFSNIKRMSSSEYIRAHILSKPKPKAKPE